jgi:hypothetical protein
VTGPANASELRELQAPIKERYREQPESERYCVVLQTLAGSPELSVSLERR